MTDEAAFMTPGDYYTTDTGTTGIADGESLTVDPLTDGVSAVEIHQLTGSADASVYWEVDPDDDGTYEISVEVDSFTGAWHSEGNSTRVRSESGQRLRIENTSGGTGHYAVVGSEIDGSLAR